MDFDDISEKMLYSVVALYFLFVFFYFAAYTPQKIFESFVDLPDTAASIKVFSEYGFFGKVPYFLDGEYYLFGSIPPFTAVLGSIVNVIVNDYILSAALLSLTANVALFYILNFVILKNQPTFYKVALSIFLLADYVLGTLFPFGWRIRQTWAIVFALLAYIKSDSKPLLFIFSFLSFISQTLVGSIFFFLLSFKFLLERDDIKKILTLLLSLMLSLLFVWKLITLSPLPPKYIGCSNDSTAFIFYYFIFFLLFLPFYIIIKKANLYEKLGMLLFSFPALSWFLYNYSSDLWYTFFSAIPFSFDLICAIFSPSLFFFVVSFFSREILPDPYKKIFAFSAYLVLMTSLSQYNVEGYGAPVFFEGKHAATYAVAITGEPSLIFDVEPLMKYSSLSFLRNEDMYFAESPISTQLSKGEYFFNLSKFTKCLWVGDEPCIPPGDQDLYILYYYNTVKGRTARSNLSDAYIIDRVLNNAAKNNLTAYNISKLIIIQRNP
ncbi:MAG: hypothetical protein QXY61_01160 [Candidatus Anstonellales archaeon]